MAEQQRRQLAAVMFADIVGYTALMQANERRSYLESVGAYNDVGSVRGIGTSLIGLAAIEAVEGRAVEEGRSLSVTEALELARAGHSVVDE